MEPDRLGFSLSWDSYFAILLVQSSLNRQSFFCHFVSTVITKQTKLFCHFFYVSHDISVFTGFTPCLAAERRMEQRLPSTGFSTSTILSVLCFILLSLSTTWQTHSCFLCQITLETLAASFWFNLWNFLSGLPWCWKFYFIFRLNSWTK